MQEEDSEKVGSLTMGLSFFSESIQLIRECKTEDKIKTLLLTIGGNFHVSDNFGFDWTALQFNNSMVIKNLMHFSEESPQVVLISTQNFLITTANCFEDY